jgi:hypothetical protein
VRHGTTSEGKQQIVDMAMNASGIRDTARVLQHLHPAHVAVEFCRADELAHRRGLTSELDEMWSYVGKKAEPRWLWHAINHQMVTPSLPGTLDDLHEGCE